MNTLIRIHNINESVIERLVVEFNRSIPGFCKNTGKHLHEPDLYSFILSSEEEWDKHIQQVLEILSRLGDSLLRVKDAGAILSINTCIHMYDFRSAFLVDFVFPTNLLQTITTIGASLEMSMYIDNGRDNQEDQDA